MRPLRPYIIGAALGALGLAMLPLAGLLGHSASGGPWLSGWYHWLAARQSVTLRSLAVPVPPLDDPAMARRAAGHYEMACALCHGSPAAPPARLAQDLRPAPPPLARADRWRPPARLFRTVKHGIARSAMPGWPVQTRDDEVWDMVAFLRRLPELSAEDYRGMAGEGRCADCHGEAGEGRDGIPRLDIHTPEYIEASLRAFRDGRRASGTMIAAARGLSDAEIAELARRFGRELRVEPLPGQGAAPPVLAGREVPQCLACHGPAARRDYPRLLGQDRDYLRRQLRLFADLGEERGGPHAAVMARVVRWLRPYRVEQPADWFGR